MFELKKALIRLVPTSRHPTKSTIEDYKIIDTPLYSTQRFLPGIYLAICYNVPECIVEQTNVSGDRHRQVIGEKPVLIPFPEFPDTSK